MVTYAGVWQAAIESVRTILSVCVCVTLPLSMLLGPWYLTQVDE